MSAPAAAAFRPPDASQVAAYLEAFPRRSPSAWAARAPLVLLLAVVAATLIAGFIDGPGATLLPWLALGAMVTGFVWLGRRNRDRLRLAAGVEHVSELIARRHHASALRQAWMMLPATVRLPALHVRLVAAMGQALAGVRRYNAALRCYDDVVGDLQSDHPITAQIHIARALAQLHTEHLSDADDTLRRLRGSVDIEGHHPTAAAYATARLLQAIKTHHYADALDDLADSSTLNDDPWLKRLRPLGVEAGYAYGMLTLCYAELASRAEPDAAGGLWSAARRWWGRATLLLSGAAVTYRLPELRRWVEPGGELHDAATPNPFPPRGPTPAGATGLMSPASWSAVAPRGIVGTAAPEGGGVFS